MDWVKEHSMFGYSATLVYKNYGTGQANLFVGGALDLNNKAGTAPRFYLGITRVLENGNSNASSTFLIRVETVQLEVDPNYIDHMFLDTYAG